MATLELCVGLELEGRLTELLSYVVLCSIVVVQFLEQFNKSLDWALSQWAHFTVLRFILFGYWYVYFVYNILYYCNIVRWTWWG